MLDRIIGGSVLIVLLAALRPLLRGRVRPLLAYGLWLLAAARLLLPTPPITSPASAVGRLEASAPVQAAVDRAEEALLPYFAREIELDSGETALSYREVTEDYPRVETNYSHNPNGTLRLLEAETVWQLPLWRWAWWGGMGLCALWLLGQDAALRLRLRRQRRPLAGAESPLPVYLAPDLPSPCLLGLLRPAVYLPEGDYTAAQLRHILAHEETHWRHGDHLWAWLRGACLVVHWFNPLVWWGASLSRRDGELACDDGAIRRLGEEEAADYGRTLLRLVTARPRPGDLLRTATTMSGGKAGLRERIRLLARRPKVAAAAVAVLVLAVAVGLAAAFTGGDRQSPEEVAVLADYYGAYTAADQPVQNPALSFLPAGGWQVVVRADRFSAGFTYREEAVEAEDPAYRPTDCRLPDWASNLTEEYGEISAFAVADTDCQLWMGDGALLLVECGEEGVPLRIWPLRPAETEDRWPAYGPGQEADLFAAAEAAWDWFYLGTAPVADGDSRVDLEGGVWLRAEIPGVETLADLRAYLETLFAPELAEELLATGRFRDFDGVLYVNLSSGRGSNLYAGEREVSYFPYSGRDGGFVAVKVEVLDEDLETVVGTKQFNFSFTTAREAGGNDGYVFTNFGPRDDVDPQAFHQARALYDSWRAGNPPEEWISLVSHIDWDAYRQVSGEDQEAGAEPMTDIMGDLYEYASGNDLPEDQVLALMNGTVGLDGAWSEGYSYMLYQLYGRHPARFAADLENEVDAVNRQNVRMYLRSELAWDMGREESLTEEELDQILYGPSARPEPPYLTIYALDETGEETQRHFPLTDAEAEALLEEATVEPPGDFVATLTLEDETCYYSRTDGVPQSVLDLAVERCGYRFQTPADLGTLAAATLVCGWLEEPERPLDPADLPRLEAMLKNARPLGYMGACGFGVPLRLTFTDGGTMTVFKGSDGCDTIAFASWGCYTIGDRENQAFWEMFGLDPSFKALIPTARYGLAVYSPKVSLLSLMGQWEQLPWTYLTDREWTKGTFQAETFGTVFQAETTGLDLQALKREDGTYILISMEVTSPDFPTGDGLAVGSSRQDLLDLYGGNTPAEGELRETAEGYRLQPPQDETGYPFGFLYIDFTLEGDAITAIRIYNGLDG